MRFEDVNKRGVLVVSVTAATKSVFEKRARRESAASDAVHASTLVVQWKYADRDLFRVLANIS